MKFGFIVLILLIPISALANEIALSAENIARVKKILGEIPKAQGRVEGPRSVVSSGKCVYLCDQVTSIIDVILNEKRDWTEEDEAKCRRMGFAKCEF